MRLSLRKAARSAPEPLSCTGNPGKSSSPRMNAGPPTMFSGPFSFLGINAGPPTTLYRHILVEIALGHAEAFLIGFAEIRTRVFGCAVEFVFVFDAHRTVIADALQNAEELRPIDTAHAGNAELPPPGLVYRDDSAPAHDVPVNPGVLEVDVIDLVQEVFGGLNGIHHLPQEMRGVVLQTDIRGILEGGEQRFEPHRAGGNVGAALPRLPQDAHLVLLASGEILFVVDAHDFVHLSGKWFGGIFAGLRSYIGNA